MRISVSEDDPGFLPPHLTRDAKVFLDGRILEDCITADEERGEAVVYLRDDRQNIIVQQGRPVTIFVKGKVEIVLPKAA